MLFQVLREPYAILAVQIIGHVLEELFLSYILEVVPPMDCGLFLIVITGGMWLFYKHEA